MVVVVASAAAGREVADELGRIREGERPPDDEVRQRQWAAVIAEARARWQTLRVRIEERRSKRREDAAGVVDVTAGMRRSPDRSDQITRDVLPSDH